MHISRTLGGERTDPSVWTQIIIVLVKVVKCRSEFLFVVKGHHAKRYNCRDRLTDFSH